jgi:hypothetical protein
MRKENKIVLVTLLALMMIVSSAVTVRYGTSFSLKQNQGGPSPSQVIDVPTQCNGNPDNKLQLNSYVYVYVGGSNNQEGITAIKSALTIWEDTLPIDWVIESSSSSQGNLTFSYNSNPHSNNAPVYIEYDGGHHYPYCSPGLLLPINIYWNSYYGAQCNSNNFTFAECVALYSQVIGYALGLATDCGSDAIKLMANMTCPAEYTPGLPVPWHYVLGPSWDEMYTLANMYGFWFNQGWNGVDVNHGLYSYSTGCGWKYCPPANTSVPSACSNCFVDYFEYGASLPIDKNNNGTIEIWGVAFPQTPYRFGVQFETSADPTAQGARAADLELDNYGVAYCDYLYAGYQNCMTLSNALEAIYDYAYSIIWISANPWTSYSDLLSVNVYDIGSGGGGPFQFDCGSSGERQIPGTSCYPPALTFYATMLGEPYYHYYSKTYCGGVCSYLQTVGVWSDGGNGQTPYAIEYQFANEHALPSCVTTGYVCNTG